MPTCIFCQAEVDFDELLESGYCADCIDELDTVSELVDETDMWLDDTYELREFDDPYQDSF